MSYGDTYKGLAVADEGTRTAAEISLMALDIGGANLKLADGRGYAAALPFALWQAPEQLADQLRACLAAAPASEVLAVTMTGELADCFATKADGVRHIVGGVIEASGGRDVLIYLTDGSLVAPRVAIERPLAAAASNWHALAAFAAHEWAGPALLLDAGSTTVDMIPLVDGRSAARGRTDPERLAHGELVYTGIERSPVCAIVGELPWRGGWCPVAQELFATAADVYLLLGELPEEPSNTDTADGQPRTRSAAHARLARCICADSTMMTLDEAIAAARHVADAQVALVQTALARVAAPVTAAPQTAILSGHGEFLLRWVLERVGFDGKTVSLTEKIGPHVSRSATAHALAALAREHIER